MRIILLGPPGAGKGTQAEALAKRLNLTHISTGDILRQNVSKNTQLGKEAKSYMDKGELVPDELVTQMLKDRLSQENTQKSFILDGYPRNLNQAKNLDDILRQRNSNIDLVIYLDTSVGVIIQRLTGRLVCNNCGMNFHIKNMPPKADMLCDNCGGKLYQRTDDNAETIKMRLDIYKKEVLALIKYYEQEQKLKAVTADEEADIVLERIVHLVRVYNDSLKV